MVLYPGCVGGGADVFGGFHRVRVSGIHTKGCALQKLRHGAGQQAAGMYGNAGGLALFLGPQVGCYADGNGNAQRGGGAGEIPPFGSAAEHNDPHTPWYPRGVTIHPLT